MAEIILIILLIALAIYAFPIVCVIAIVIGIYRIGELVYFRSDKFKVIQDDFKDLKDDFNNFNEHIESLKNADLLNDAVDYGEATISDSSRYNYQRKEYQKYVKTQNIHNCSRQVASNARSKPFEYIMKYFNVPANEESLEYFEDMLNSFSAAEQGREYLRIRQEEITTGVKERLPFLVRKFGYKRAIQKIGFEKIDLETVYFPSYTFQYVSAGGNASLKTDIMMSPENIERFINLINSKIKWRKSVAGQRALMTCQLREKIKERDHCTCKYCKNSLKKEPNLLLEIDHIKPLAKGGMTTEDNLQTLCWRCNRSKGAK